MDQQWATGYLASVCVPANPAPLGLHAEWITAQSQLGAPLPDAGQVTVSPIPPAHAAYEQSLRNAPMLAPFFQEGWDLRLVEPIDNLLAFQAHVDLERTDALCHSLPVNPTLTDALPLCLPLTIPAVPHFPAGYPPTEPLKLQSLIFKSPSLDLRIANKGQFPNQLIGIQLGIAPPFAQVVRFNGRCYLRNGFHRTYGLRLRDFHQVPCVYREVKEFKDVADGPPATFGQTLLESNNPPTIGHYTQGRAYNVSLRKFSRVIHIGWADYVVPEE
jgi:hypothetical protein